MGDGKIQSAALKCVGQALKRKILRVEERLYNQGKEMSGRQSMRMILENFKTDRISKELFNVTHLHDLQYLGDSKLEEFIESWYRIEDDQEDPLKDRQKERILYDKIRNSKVLKPYLDRYSMLDDEDDDHSYTFLITSIDNYL